MNQMCGHLLSHSGRFSHLQRKPHINGWLTNTWLRTHALLLRRRKKHSNVCQNHSHVPKTFTNCCCVAGKDRLQRGPTLKTSISFLCNWVAVLKPRFDAAPNLHLTEKYCRTVSFWCRTYVLQSLSDKTFSYYAQNILLILGCIRTKCS